MNSPQQLRAADIIKIPFIISISKFQKYSPGAAGDGGAKLTIDQLRSYRRKSRELEQEKARYNGMIFDSKKPDISGARSGTSDTVSRVVIRREKKLAEIRALETELKIIREYISRCNNYYREPIFMHYVEGRSWVQIATQFSYNSADALRMSCKRYVASHPNL